MQKVHRSESVGLSRARRAALVMWPAHRDLVARIAWKLADQGFPCPGDDPWTWFRRIEADVDAAVRAQSAKAVRRG